MIYSKETISQVPHRSTFLPPVIVKFDGISYAIFTDGFPKIAIEDSVTIEDVYSIWSQYSKPIVESLDAEWTVLGSKNKEYIVSFISGEYSCTCRGYTFYRNCKHIKSVQE